jgi:benzaldehyde dehydrogenase (NAD)
MPMTKTKQSLSATSREGDVLFDAKAYRGMLFGGKGFRASQDGTIDVLEKATGEVLHVAGFAGPREVSEAVRSAAEAQRSWAEITGPERGDVLRRFSSLVETHQKEIKEWIIRETGSIMGKACSRSKCRRAKASRPARSRPNL